MFRRSFEDDAMRRHGDTNFAQSRLPRSLYVHTHNPNQPGRRGHRRCQHMIAHHTSILQGMLTQNMTDPTSIDTYLACTNRLRHRQRDELTRPGRCYQRPRIH